MISFYHYLEQQQQESPLKSGLHYLFMSIEQFKKAAINSRHVDSLEMIYQQILKQFKSTPEYVAMMNQSAPGQQGATGQRLG